MVVSIASVIDWKPIGPPAFEARRGIGMLGAERLLVDRQRPLVERPRAGEVALILKQMGEVVEARRGIGMLGAERLLSDRQRPLEKGPRAGEVSGPNSEDAPKGDGERG